MNNSLANIFQVNLLYAAVNTEDFATRIGSKLELEAIQSTEPSHLQTVHLYWYLMPLLGALAIVLNGMVVVSSGLILRQGVAPRCTYLFLANVALADLIAGTTVLFGTLFPKQWRDAAFCSLEIGLIVSSTITSIWSVVLITVDRFIYIVHSLHYVTWVNESRAVCLIVSTWVLGLLIGFPPLMGWTSDLTKDGQVCWFIYLAPPPLIALTAICGVIPLLINLTLYSILYHSLKKMIQLQECNRGIKTSTGLRMSKARELSNETDKRQNAIKWKAIKVVLFTNGSYVITWFPYFVTCMFYVSIDDIAVCKKLTYAIASPLPILGFCYSLLNPIIYAWWNNNFRTYARKLLCRTRMPTMTENTSKVVSITNSSCCNSLSKQHTDVSLSHKETDV